MLNFCSQMKTLKLNTSLNLNQKKKRSENGRKKKDFDQFSGALAPKSWLTNIKCVCVCVCVCVCAKIPLVKMDVHKAPF